MQLWQRAGDPQCFSHPKYQVDALGFFVEVVPHAAKEAMLMLGRNKAMTLTLEQLNDRLSEVTLERDRLRQENDRLRKNQKEQAELIDTAEGQLKKLTQDLQNMDILCSQASEGQAARKIVSVLMEVEAAVEHCRLLCLIESCPDAIADVDMLLQTEEVLNLLESAQVDEDKFAEEVLKTTEELP